ncbi:hydrocephalus-inducing protein-like [Cuculus canorus]|uniref:hydrocephalus-inducing protein-like n=1 Tax=Cuculus canorus TaxID=55661 RepID=UPI0023AAC6DC|nr:hydrocephalus-inducing protein-like [Cuculus canorus]
MEQLTRELEEKRQQKLKHLEEKELLMKCSRMGKRWLGEARNSALRRKSEAGVRQILDDLGLGPSGPPVPPTTFYSVVHYPEKWVAPAAEDLEHFIFVVPEGTTAEDKRKDTASGLKASAVLPVKRSELLASPTRRRVKEKAVVHQKAAEEKPSSGQGRRGQQDAPTYSLRVKRSRVNMVQPPQRPARLSHCQWIVPAHDKVELKVHFSSTELGQFDQTLHFEILGTKRQYQLQCRGTCLYPAISQDPRVVFPHQRKSKVDDDIVSKQYVMDKGVFHFGPLLCGKSKDWYKAEHCPSNFEKINILNITSSEAEVHFCFEHDRRMDVFRLDPPSMRLKPNEKQELSIWAYPTSTGLKADNLICCIEDNPDPAVFRLCCQGVQVKLEVSPKKVQFKGCFCTGTAIHCCEGRRYCRDSEPDEDQGTEVVRGVRALQCGNRGGF